MIRNISSDEKGEKMGRKKLRDKFEDCYTAVPVPAANAKGFRMKYIYYAPWYVWDMPKELLMHLKCAMLLCSVAGFCMALLSMLQKSPVNRSPVVFGFCALSLCCHVMEFFGLVQLLAARYRTTKMTYEDVNKLLLTAPIARAIFDCVPALLCVFNALRGGGAILLGMAAGYGLSAASALWVRYRYSRIPVITEENDSLEQYDNGLGQKFSISGKDGRP